MARTQELYYLGIAEMAELIRARRVSPVEVVQAHLGRIGELDGHLHAYITVLEDQALAAARHAEREIQGGSYRGPLHGVPIGLKDLIYTRDAPTTGGSQFLRDFVPECDATVTERLRNAGAIVLGKLNLHEFAMGGVDGNPFYGVCRNPWGEDRFAGGSSGGSGVSVAAGMAAGALGTDTTGSVRIPAGLCGIVGLKPSFGRVSRRGVMAISWTLDHVGPMTRSVEDCALLLQAIAGHDSQDPHSANVPVPDYRRALTGDIKGLRIGVPRVDLFSRVSAEVRLSIEGALSTMAELGASVQDVAIPYLEYAPTVAMTISLTEGLAYHRRWMGEHLNDYGAGVRERLEMGSAVPGAAYVEALRLQRVVARAFDGVLRDVDVLVIPGMAAPAHRLGEKFVDIDGKQVDWREAGIHLMRPVSLTGLPALSLPCGFSSEGLPIGFQLVGHLFDESALFQVGDAYQRATDWHTRHPFP